MGLIGRAIERIGIPTTSISIAKDLTRSVGMPRTVFVRWSRGHPLGEPENALQPRTMIFEALRLLVDGRKRGLIVEPGFRWRREVYVEPDWSRLSRPDDSTGI